MSISSEEDLNKLGSVDDIVQDINKKISPLKIVAETYADLFQSIKSLQENWLPFKTGYFINERDRYIYILLNHEGEDREKLLGIDDSIYKNKKLAKRWFNKIAHILRADINDREDATAAFKTLREIYSDLIDDVTFGDNND